MRVHPAEVRSRVLAALAAADGAQTRRDLTRLTGCGHESINSAIAYLQGTKQIQGRYIHAGPNERPRHFARVHLQREYWIPKQEPQSFRDDLG